MRPLTDHLPKPLLQIHGQSLLEHHLVRLKAAGFSKVVINHAWLGQLIEDQLGDGSRLGLDILYSPEKEALETAGGIRQALDLLAPNDYFFVINGDVYSPDFPFDGLAQLVKSLRKQHSVDQITPLAYLFLVANPEHHPEGDFYLMKDATGLGRIYSEIPALQMGFSSEPPTHIATSDAKRHTFSGAGLYHKSLFEKLIPGVKAPLAPLLKEAMTRNQVFGELLSCPWHDVGTPERLEQLNRS